jgi:sec-independent protein translocase protein TatC
MILTPPDVFSQTMLAVPMWVLFEAGLLACVWLKRPEPGKENVAGL